MRAHVAAQGLHVRKEIELLYGQAVLLQVDHRADAHDVRQEGGRRHYAARMLHRRQRLRKPTALSYLHFIVHCPQTSNGSAHQQHLQAKNVFGKRLL